jgi:hypothetical protein
MRRIPALFDANSLISSAKYSIRGRLVIDYILQGCTVKIPQKVKGEVVDEGIVGGYPDAVEIQKRINNGQIDVIPDNPLPGAFEELLTDYGLEDGDKSIIASRLRQPRLLMVSDDQLLYIVASRLGWRILFLPDLIVRLFQKGIFNRAISLKLLFAIRPRFGKGLLNIR